MFNEFIKDFKAGHLDATLSNKLHDLVEAVERNQRAGKLTVEISLKPKGNGEVATAIKYKLQAPERDTMESIMFATVENRLVAMNPAQPELFNTPVREAEDKPRVVKSI